MVGIFHVGGALKTLLFKYHPQEEIADRKIGRSRWPRNILIAGDTTHTHTHTHTRLLWMFMRHGKSVETVFLE